MKTYLVTIIWLSQNILICQKLVDHSTEQIDQLASDKSRSFTQPRLIIVNYTTLN